MRKLAIWCCKVVGSVSLIAVELYVITEANGITVGQLPEFFLISMFGPIQMAKFFGGMMLLCAPIIFTICANEVSEIFSRMGKTRKGENE